MSTSEKIFIADWVKNEGKKEADNRVEGVAPLCGLAFHLRHPAALVAEKLDGATAKAVGSGERRRWPSHRLATLALHEFRL